MPVRVSVLEGQGGEGRTTTLSETMEESRVAAMVTKRNIATTIVRKLDSPI